MIFEFGVGNMWNRDIGKRIAVMVNALVPDTYTIENIIDALGPGEERIDVN